MRCSRAGGLPQGLWPITGDLLRGAKPAGVSCLKSPPVVALNRTYVAQDLLGFISVRADDEWGADRHSDSGRLEAVGAALGLVAGYDGEGVSEKVRFRLSHGAVASVEPGRW